MLKNKLLKTDIFYINSKITGGHYAFKTLKSVKPFENNMRECKSIKLQDSDIVADIGAYVGEYSMYASRQGVKKVYSYEPTPRTFKLLKKNKFDNMIIHNRAVVGGDNKHVELFISKGIGVTNSIAKKKNKLKSVKVKAIKYEHAVKDATVVKIDVEGAEYGYNIIQPSIRAVILEFHPLVGEPWRDYANKIMEELRLADFKAVIEPTFKSGWNLTGSWMR